MSAFSLATLALAIPAEVVLHVVDDADGAGRHHPRDLVDAGIVLISLAGWLIYGERLDGPALAGIGLIVAGVLVIHLMSASLRS